MPKITEKQIADAAKAVGIDEIQRQELLAKLAELLESLPPADEEKAPPVKKEHVVLIADADGRVARALEAVGLDALTGWVVQIPEEAPPQSALAKVHEAARAFNRTKKGRVRPAQTVGEAMEAVPARIAKEQQLWVKTRGTIYALPVPVEIDGAPGLFDADSAEEACAKDAA